MKKIILIGLTILIIWYVSPFIKKEYTLSKLEDTGVYTCSINSEISVILITGTKEEILKRSNFWNRESGLYCNILK